MAVLGFRTSILENQGRHFENLKGIKSQGAFPGDFETNIPDGIFAPRYENPKFQAD